ncbi:MULTISPECIES: aldehyde dehydrogenase family protein [Amycolatopsis]|uniref:aldehyde dehydrogenase family protein n=1 Tax=Amycolatopsis TaxID=1813 RepID=UPI000AAADC49|nr:MULTISPECIES: aldehyde dehydrogenase family protein [Amycolatopsis]
MTSAPGRQRADELAATMTVGMGKRINEGRGGVGIVVDIFRCYAERGPDPPLPIRGGSAVLRKEPIGALLGVLPGNFPCCQVVRFVAPILVLGNMILLKHASICPRSTLTTEKIPPGAGVAGDAYVNTFASGRQFRWFSLIRAFKAFP